MEKSGKRPRDGEESDSSQEGDEDGAINAILQNLEDLQKKLRSRKKKAEEAKKLIASQEDVIISLSSKCLQLEAQTKKMSDMLCQERLDLADLRQCIRESEKKGK
jgi:dsDNA-specific endonuclease/ATPase MutS2